MQCWQCGVNVRPGQKLCVYCGAKLTEEDEREYGAPGERSGSSSRGSAGGERESRWSSGGGGARGARGADDDGWSAYDARPDRPNRSSGRPRGGGERDQGEDELYRPGGKDAGSRGEGRASSRHPGGMQLPARGEEPRSRDPFDDPRAPRSLRATPSAARSTERDRGSYGGEVSDEADYEYDDYNPRDRASPRYQPRFDPESAEYDAVADERRQARVRPRGYERDGGSARGARSREAEPRGDARAGRDGRDGRRYEEYDASSRREDDYGRGGRGAAPADPRGGRYAPERGGAYGGYGGYGEEESAEYPASYGDRDGRWERGGGQVRAGYERYGGMEQPGYGGGSRDRRDNRSAGGYNAPLEDSWQQPAMGAASARDWDGGGTWTPGTDPNSWAPPGAAYAPKPAKGGRRGLMAAVVAVAVVGLLVVGFLGRSHILALLHRGGNATTSSPPGTATFTPGPTPTTLPSYKLYVSTHSQYAIEYPAAWAIQNTSSSSSSGYDYLDTFVQGSPVASIGVETAQAFNSATNDQIIQGEVEGAKQAKLTFTQIGGEVTVSVGGESWSRRDYSVTASNGVTLHMAILAAHHAGRAYAIVLTAGASDFARDDAGVFKTILSTFRFTG